MSKAGRSYANILSHYNAKGQLLLNVRRPYAGPWAYAEGEGEGEGDKDEGGSGDKGKSSEDLNKEIESLKAQLADKDKALGDVAPRLAELEKIQKEKDDRQRKKDEEDKIKSGKAKELLEEKDKELEKTQAALKSLEDQERARVEELFKTLPEESQKAIEEFKDKLGLADWSALVSKQAALTKKDGADFIGGGDDKEDLTKKYETTERAKAIMEDIGRGHEGTKKLVTSRDPESGATKFTMPVRQFFKEMDRAPVFRQAVQGPNKE